MECRIDDVVVNYVEHGSGVPLIGLHGAGVDHREIEAALEAVVPVDGYRRIYPDLPGMGRTTTGAGSLNGNDDVVTLMAAFVGRVVDGPFLLLGHSYGGYLARGIVARQPESVLGLALLCPIGERSRDVPQQTAVQEDAEAYDELGPDQRAGFDDYFVIRTRATARRYRDCVVPGAKLVDEEGLGRIFSGWPIAIDANAFTAPTLIAAGRLDSSVGYASAVDLLPCYPQATLAVLDRAGHALPHEQPALLKALLHDWLARSTPSARHRQGLRAALSGQAERSPQA